MSAAGSPMTFDKLRDDVAQMIGVPAEEIENDDNLIDHGLDSVRLLNLAARWNDEGIELQFADLIESPTLNDWWQLVEQQRSRES